MKTELKNIALIIIGTLIFALGISYFTIPNELSEGGIIGVTVITYYLFGWSTGIMNLIINAFLIAIGYKLLDRQTTIYTIWGIIFSSIFLYITEHTGRMLTDDSLLAAIFSGVLVGVGLGIVFRTGGTTGGSAIIARLMNKYLGWSIGMAMLIVDIFVIGGSAFIIGAEKTMYTLIAVYIGAKIVDFIIEGIDTRKAINIISHSPDLIAEKVTQEMERGVTVLKGYGAYTKQKKEILYIVINKQELMQLKKIIHSVDPEAFVVIHDVRDVFGRGFSIEDKEEDRPQIEAVK
ncbi:YitT family protein [Priestia taiwanensis]|uniref:Membrane protein n=1 Tax=Priestia taiwanensis TaxID=1347902 RepID=A0A917AVA2_9BACI|nr:YitT family protein [Priestia taiwanensis]MBM7364696.1 uncharacterized membrane-anchored protein YitT (DUF2179 family) [Priestia taiwanensis]GGE78943.1 membrane protein [Priestia taiwanensis]